VNHVGLDNGIKTAGESWGSGKKLSLVPWHLGSIQHFLYGATRAAY